MKKTYIKPQAETIALTAQRNLLLVVSGTETDDQMASELDIDDADLTITLVEEDIL